jgi:Leucine-rich repeat (LRR) protein
LQALTSLEVAGNQLDALPDEISGLSALQKLAAFGNRLTTLPAGLGGLAALKELWLQGNQLTALPAAIGQLTVRCVAACCLPVAGRRQPWLALNAQTNQ